MKVIVTSRETIKPLCPTPQHLCHVQLSFLDQITNQNWVPWIHFYQYPSSGSVLGLKKSLAETLTKFYPLAGRVKQNLFVDCNDQGVDYFEAKANSLLSHLLAQPNQADLNKLLPYPYDQLNDAGDRLLGIQVNVFNCGGIAIGTCLSHKIADALSGILFVNSWAATARGDHKSVISPKFDFATLFPPRDLSSYGTMSTGITKEKIVMKKFVFSAAAVSGLKAKYASDMGSSTSSASIRPPSRVESLSAFIWSRFMAATQGEARGLSLVVQAVNLRTRMNPPLPISYFGNFSRFAITTATTEKCSTSTTEKEALCRLISQMRTAVTKIDSNYVEELQQGKTHMNSGRKPCADDDRLVNEFVLQLPQISFSSLVTFPLYEADFGWGKPIYVSLPAQPFENMVIFMPSSSGDGIEALMNMKEDDIAKLEADKEFLELVSSTSTGASGRLVSSL